jgi:Uncharacterized proteins, LmbE homologs
MCVTKLIFNKIAPIPDLTSFNRYLFIGPHPDDIEIGAGGTAARLAKEGKEVYFLTATDGCYGGKDKTKAEIVAVRKKEAEAAAALIGAKEYKNLGFSDGGLYPVEELAKALTVEIGRVQPDVILAPDPRLQTECHADHLKTGQAAANAFIMCGNALIMSDLGGTSPASPKALAHYYTARPNSFVGIKKYLKTQLDAISLHKSQFSEEKINGGISEKDGLFIYLKFRAIRFGLKTGKGKAEGFYVMPPLYTHCCAEKV